MTMATRHGDGGGMARAWRAYAALALLRVFAALYALGMVHPDEFFQSQEVMARHVLQHDATLQDELHVPWEYQLPTPNRSVLFPSLVAGIPYKLLHLLGVPMTGRLLLVVPRVLLCLASFGVDALLYRSAVALKVRNPMHAVLLFASSWTTVVFMTRPFSNTFETIVLALSVATLLCVDPHRRLAFGLLHLQTLLLGSLLAVGFFTRFTFPFFFFPLGLELVRRQDELLVQQMLKKQKTTIGVPRRLLRVLSVAVQGFIAFSFWSALIIVIDSAYFRGEVSQVSDLIVAPWNNLLYNLKHDNLELHGVHPRITHFAVNMPMLFGPLFVVFVDSLVFSSRPWTKLWKISCVVIPLVLLSMAPHQEPRFLLPLTVPLHLFWSKSVVKSRPLRSLWIMFNIALGLFFGVLHQGGLVPLLLNLSQTTTGSSTSSVAGCRFGEPLSLLSRDEPLLFYKTYMPPRFVLSDATRPWGTQFRVVDLAGGAALEQQLREDVVALSKSVLIAAPASVSVDGVLGEWGGQEARVRVLGTCYPHVTTEDLDLDKPFELVIYRLEK